MSALDLISVDPGICHWQACIQGTRIPVHVVLGFLAEGATEADIMADYPTLTAEGIRAAAEYGALLASQHLIPFPTSGDLDEARPRVALARRRRIPRMTPWPIAALVLLLAGCGDTVTVITKTPGARATEGSPSASAASPPATAARCAVQGQPGQRDVIFVWDGVDASSHCRSEIARRPGEQATAVPDGPPRCVVTSSDDGSRVAVYGGVNATLACSISGATPR